MKRRVSARRHPVHRDGGPMRKGLQRSSLGGDALQALVGLLWREQQNSSLARLIC